MKTIVRNSLFIVDKLIPLLLLIMMITSCERPVSVSPPDEPPPDGFLLIDSTPPDAKIFINGKDRRRITPDSVTWLTTGDYAITLKKEFFRDTTIITSVVEGERHSILVDYFSNPAMLGKISCLSTPDSAYIYINDEYTGLKTPNEIPNLIPGYYQVKYDLPMHLSAEGSVIVRSNEVTEFQATLVDTTIWKLYNTSNTEISSNELTCILITSSGKKYIGTNNDGLVEYDGQTWINYRESNSKIPDDKVTCMAEDFEHHVWIGTSMGLMEIEDGNSWKQHNTKSSPPPPLSSYYIVDIRAVNSEMGVWLTTKNEFAKCWRYTDPEIAPLIIDKWSIGLSISDSFLPGNNFTDIVRYNGVSWVGTTGRGIVRFIADEINVFDRTDGLARDNISKLAVDEDGNIWIGHKAELLKSGGLTYYKDGVWTNYSHLINGESVTKIYIDSRGNKWIATDKLVYIVVGNNEIRRLSFDTTGLDFKNINGFADDQNGNMWMTSPNIGLICVEIDIVLDKY